MPMNQRRLTGMTLGLLAGLLYSLLSGSINALVLPGVPMRLDWTQVIANTILGGLGAAAAGLITAWPESSFKGLVAGALAIAVFGVGRSLFSAQGGENLTRTVLMAVPTLLPAVAFAAPLTSLLRWGVNLHLDALTYAGRPRLFRLGRLYLALLALTAFAGSLSRMSAGEERAVRQVNTLVQKGLAAASPQAVPNALQRIPDFRARAVGRYSLDRSTNLSADSSIAGSTAVEVTLIDVRFDSGLHFECQLGSSLSEPLCTEK